MITHSSQCTDDHDHGHGLVACTPEGVDFASVPFVILAFQTRLDLDSGEVLTTQTRRKCQSSHKCIQMWLFDLPRFLTLNTSWSVVRGSSCAVGLVLKYQILTSDEKMPEMPEIQGFMHVIRTGKDFQKRYKALDVCTLHLSITVQLLTITQFFVQIVPMCFSRGSAKRSYESLTVYRGDYEIATAVPSLGLDWLDENWPPCDWRQWAENSWGYLLDPPRAAGRILCASRGKLLVIAAGHVSKPWLHCL